MGYLCAPIDGANASDRGNASFSVTLVDIAQLVEHWFSVRQVPRSNPGGPEKRNFRLPSPVGGSVAL